MSDSEFDDSDYDSFISSLDDEELESLSGVSVPSSPVAPHSLAVATQTQGCRAICSF